MNIEKSGKFSKLRVLVVDDHMLMRNIISQNLRSIGINGLESSSTGKDAWQEICAGHDAGRPYHIILLDWHMPDMEGLEVLEKCRADRRFDSTAVVMLTAEQEQSNIMKAIESGATSYLVKPVSRGALEKNLQKIMAWLEKKNPGLFEDNISSHDRRKARAANMPESLRDDLKPIVARGIENIFSELFSVKIVSDGKNNLGQNKEMVCVGRLHQKDVLILLRFFFDQALLKPLLMQLYSPKHLEQNEIYEDAACEIVNILCGQVKAFLNEHGYSLALDLPEMGLQEEKCRAADSIMNIHFSLSQEQDFLINVSTNAPRI